MLCVLILFISGGTYSLKSTPNDRFFEKLFITILFALRVFARNLLRGNRRKNTFRIRFDVWPGLRTLAFRLIRNNQGTFIENKNRLKSNMYVDSAIRKINLLHIPIGLAVFQISEV